jgi:RNA-directed DNA polymerase
VSSIDDADVTHLLKVTLRASGKKGVSYGGVVSSLLSNLYLNEADKMLERRGRSREMASTPTSNMRGSLTIW